jgi:hypothetical protein
MTVLKAGKQHWFVMGSRRHTLLSVERDSDVKVNDTEVGRGTPLTSPFIEGIWAGECAPEHPPPRSLGSSLA